MSRKDLPPDCDQPLDYSSTIETLKLLEGELVCLSISTPVDDGKSSRIQACGSLNHYAYGWAQGFAIGDGARALLWEPDFVSARLRTLEGNAIFWLEVKLHGLDFVIGDLSMQTDEFDLFP
jgi:hypothetical protein